MQDKIHSEGNFNQRLKQVVEEDGRTKADIASLVGVHPTVLSRWLKNVQPDASNVSRLAEVLNLNVHWLMNGEGKRRSDWEETRMSEPMPPQTIQDVLPDGALNIHWLPVVSWAHAGEAACYEELPSHWQEKIPMVTRSLRAFGLLVEGDSMRPRCEPGDIVAVDPDQQPRNGCLVVAKLKNDGVVLRRYVPLDAGRVKLIPYNDLYPSIEYGSNDFHWIYPVLSTVRKEMS